MVEKECGVKVTGIILAGGRSNRMGRNKALLELGGLSLIERVARVMDGVCAEIIIAGGRQEDLGGLGYPIVQDIHPGCGPLSGLHAGLTAAGCQYSFVSACDTPFLSQGLIRRLVARAEGFDAAILKHGEYFEPLTSVYGKGFIPAAEECIKRGVYKVTAALELVRWQAVSIESDEIIDLHKILFNINTPQDYKDAKEIKNKTGPC